MPGSTGGNRRVVQFFDQKDVCGLAREATLTRIVFLAIMVAILTLRRSGARCAAVGLALASVLAGVSPGAVRAQEAPELDPDQVLDYAWLYSRTDDGIAFTDIGLEAQSTNILSIPVSFWMRRLPCCGNPITPGIEGRTFGVRLRLTGVIGFAQFDSISEFDINSVDLGAILPGVELLFKTGERSILRPYVDVGWGSTSSTETTLVYGELGLRTEFVWGWRRWELGLEPKLKGGYSFTDIDNVDLTHVTISAKLDARYPLGFQVGGQTPDVGVYFEPSWDPNDIEALDSGGEQKSITTQYEVGATVGFRFLAPMLCGLFRMPRLGLGYRFGDGTGGWTIKIGGDRVIRLPLP